MYQSTNTDDDGSPTHTVAAMQRGGQKGLPQYSLCNCASKSSSTWHGWEGNWIVGSTCRILVAKSPHATNLKSKHTTKPLARTDAPLELWNPSEDKDGLFEWSFYKGNPGRKIQSRYWREWTPAEPQEPQAHPGTGTTMSEGPASVTLCQPIHPTLQSATYFCYTLNKLYGETNSGTEMHSADCFQYRKFYYPSFSKRK